MEDLADNLAQQTKINSKTLDNLVTLDSKFDKVAHVQEHQTKMHSTHILEVQEGTTKECGQIQTFYREVDRLCVEGLTVIIIFDKSLTTSSGTKWRTFGIVSW